MSTWNYRILKHRLSDEARRLSGEDWWFALHEVFYDEEGTPDGYTEKPIDFSCGEDEGAEGVIASLERALNDAREWPVITVEKQWPDKGQSK